MDLVSADSRGTPAVDAVVPIFGRTPYLEQLKLLNMAPDRIEAIKKLQLSYFVKSKNINKFDRAKL